MRQPPATACSYDEAAIACVIQTDAPANLRQADVFAGLLHTSLGRYSPQQRMDSAIGRGERSAVMACLIELNAACREAEAGTPAAVQPPLHRPSLVDRSLGFFL